MFDTLRASIAGRFERGAAMARERRVNFVGSVEMFQVHGTSGVYDVTHDPIKGEWRCTCPDHEHRKLICKHIVAAMIEHDARGV